MLPFGLEKRVNYAFGFTYVFDAFPELSLVLTNSRYVLDLGFFTAATLMA